MKFKAALILTSILFTCPPLAVVGSLADNLEKRYAIDPNRIYSTGHSRGGMITYCLACESADRIVSIAPVATSFVTEPCKPSRPVAELHFQGTEDRPIPYGEGASDPKLPKSFAIDGSYRSAKGTASSRARADQCSGVSQVTYQKGQVTCETTGSCAQGVEITLCMIKGGGHTWPGSPMPVNKKWWKSLAGEMARGYFRVRYDVGIFQKTSQNAGLKYL